MSYSPYIRPYVPHLRAGPHLGRERGSLLLGLLCSLAFLRTALGSSVIRGCLRILALAGLLLAARRLDDIFFFVARILCSLRLLVSGRCFRRAEPTYGSFASRLVENASARRVPEAPSSVPSCFGATSGLWGGGRDLKDDRRRWKSWKGGESPSPRTRRAASRKFIKLVLSRPLLLGGAEIWVTQGQTCVAVAFGGLQSQSIRSSHTYVLLRMQTMRRIRGQPLRFGRRQRTRHVLSRTSRRVGIKP